MYNCYIFSTLMVSHTSITTTHYCYYYCKSQVVGGPDTTLVEGEYEEIEEGVHASSRYSSFLNNKKAVCWGLEETRLFYSALQQCGMQFSLMQTFFPHRTRKELKRKYHR